MTTPRDPPLLEAQDLRKSFAATRAVDGVSFAISKGETLGMVGESGCGKSTIARLLLHLSPPDSGEIRFRGTPIGAPRGITVATLRRKVQMVFQDSTSSLNPRLTVERSVAYGPGAHGAGRREALDIAHRAMNDVGLDPTTFGTRFPYELSGGQKQRINIARALAVGPEVLVLDEPVSALDKSVEAQVLNLLQTLKTRKQLTYLFISHDLRVIRFISDRVVVMYLGQVVETGAVEEIFRAPRHPYTRALFSTMLSGDPDRRVPQPPLTGEPPSAINPATGCRFRTRCPHAEEICSSRTPQLKGDEDSQHLQACHMYDRSSGHSAA